MLNFAYTAGHYFDLPGIGCNYRYETFTQLTVGATDLLKSSDNTTMHEI